MPPSPRQALAALLIAGLVTPLPAPAEKTNLQMDDSKRVAHVLNRLAFGPRPGEVEQVRAIGVDKWIEQQLHPEKIDDSALEARIAPFRTLKMDSKQLVENFPPPQVLKQIAEGKRPMPSDPKKRAIYESQIEAYKARQARKAEESNDATMKPDKAVDDMFDDLEMGSRRKEVMAQVDQLLKLEPNARFDAILKMPPDQRRVLARALPPEKREQLVSGFTQEQREQLQAMARPQQVVFNELASAKLMRAIYSERQLEEVMTDFWFNHFNIFVNKGADRYLTAAYERDVIRKHAFGKFEDLLVATAKDPAMLFYLDNFQSVGPDSPVGKGQVGRKGGQFGNQRGQFNRNARLRRFPGGEQPTMTPGQQNPQQRPPRGLNENYARELMELHTLGVDGGYTQKDVTEVAKVFTGWTIDRPQMGGEYIFREQMHEPGTKTVLGKKIGENGEREGREVLHMLATHPATAHFISKKLAMRFVSDDPPKALVDRMAATFTKTNGDIREVLRTLFKSPEFWAPDAYRAKVKTPLEFVVSALRTTGAEVNDAQQLIQSLQKMGMPLYGMQPPTGYSMKAESWVNSSALIDRMNFSLALAAGRMRGVSVDPQSALGQDTMAEPSSAFDRLTQALLAGDVSPQTKQTVEKEMGTAPSAAVIAGLLLGSPEFQRR